MKNFVLLVAALTAVSSVHLLTEGSNPRKPVLRIINGNNARPGQFPWQTWIECIHYNFLSASCGGSLITNKHILTAAHCVSRVILCQVSLGLVSIEEGGLSFYLHSGNIVSHEEYDEKKFINDIAIMRLRSPLRITANIHPIRLATKFQNSLTLGGALAVISGWGKIMDQQRSHNDYLQYAQVRIMPKNRCNDFYKKSFGLNIGNGQICTDFSSSNVCNGDSGGPLAIFERDNNWTLIGIVSLGISPCEELMPAVYTAVANYLPWISIRTY